MGTVHDRAARRHRQSAPWHGLALSPEDEFVRPVGSLALLSVEEPQLP